MLSSAGLIAWFGDPDEFSGKCYFTYEWVEMRIPRGWVLPVAKTDGAARELWFKFPSKEGQSLRSRMQDVYAKQCMDHNVTVLQEAVQAYIRHEEEKGNHVFVSLAVDAISEYEIMSGDAEEEVTCMSHMICVDPRAKVFSCVRMWIHAIWPRDDLIRVIEENARLRDMCDKTSDDYANVPDTFPMFEDTFVTNERPWNKRPSCVTMINIEVSSHNTPIDEFKNVGVWMYCSQFIRPHMRERLLWFARFAKRRRWPTELTTKILRRANMPAEGYCCMRAFEEQ